MATFDITACRLELEMAADMAAAGADLMSVLHVSLALVDACSKHGHGAGAPEDGLWGLTRVGDGGCNFFDASLWEVILVQLARVFSDVLDECFMDPQPALEAAASAAAAARFITLTNSERTAVLAALDVALRDDGLLEHRRAVTAGAGDLRVLDDPVMCDCVVRHLAPHVQRLRFPASVIGVRTLFAAIRTTCGPLAPLISTAADYTVAAGAPGWVEAALARMGTLGFCVLSAGVGAASLLPAELCDRCAAASAERLGQLMARCRLRGLDPLSDHFSFSELCHRQAASKRYDLALEDPAVGGSGDAASWADLQTRMDGWARPVLDASLSQGCAHAIDRRGVVISLPGAVGQKWHRDGPAPGLVNVFTPLVPLSESNGPTELKTGLARRPDRPWALDLVLAGVPLHTLHTLHVDRGRSISCSQV